MISADDIADLARNIVTQTATEVRIRCGVSRAYYAAFHYCSKAADTWCDELSESDKKEHGTHTQLYIRLEKYCNNKAIESELRKMAAEAKKLRALRTDADYHLNKTIDNKIHTRSLHLMSTVKSYLTTISK